MKGDAFMKLNKDFLVHKTGSEVVVIPTGNADFSGIIKGNETLGVILDYLKEDTTKETIVSEMKKIYDDENSHIESDVNSVITRLKSIGAIDD